MDIVYFDKYVFLEETTSTNDVCKSLGEISELKSALVVTDFQSSGRGTRGRSWVMDKGKNLMFSLMLKPDIQAEKAQGLTMLMSVAIINALNKYSKSFKIKWPNDIVYEGKKLCGILTELSFKNGKVNYVVIGAGINCNSGELPEEISSKAISLKKVINYEINKEDLLGEIIEEFLILYKQYLAYGMKSIVESIRYYSAVIGKKAEIETNGNKVKCKVLDIGEEGELIVEYEDKSIEKLVSAQIFVDGIYNYVFN